MITGYTRFFLLFGLLWLAGCSLTPAALPPSNPTPRSTDTAAPPAPRVTHPPTLAPTHTPAPTPTASPPPSPTPTLHPMSIPGQRARIYPASPITVVETLEPGANYQRYYVYYLSDGLKIYALLTIPNGEKPPGGWPAIVFNHGYIPPDVYRTTERYIAYVDNLARRDYVVLRIDYRGHDQSEGAARGAYGDPGYLTDVMNAVAAIQAYPDVDPQRIGIWGHSMGGYLALRAMVISPAIKAGVIWAGVVGSYEDMLTRWRRPAAVVQPTPGAFRGWRGAWVEQFGSPEDNPDFWNSLSANSYLADVSGPIQLHHGSADADVPWEFSQTLYDQMSAAGKEVEFYIYPQDDHNLSNGFSLAMQRTLEFYDRYLKNPAIP